MPNLATRTHRDPDTGEYKLFVATDDYQMTDLLSSNGLLRDAWLHAPRLDHGNVRELDITNYWPLFIDLLWERDDDWANDLRHMIVDHARRCWPHHPKHKPPVSKPGDAVSGTMTFTLS